MYREAILAAVTVAGTSRNRALCATRAHGTDLAEPPLCHGPQRGVRHGERGLGTTKAYQLQAYIPNNHSDASHAHHHFCVSSGWCGDGTAQITLADDGGDPYPEQVGADAIRAVPTGVAC